MKYNPLDGDRAAIDFNNQLERNASEKRWDAYYKGCSDARSNRVFCNTYTNKDEIEMYGLGYKNIYDKKITKCATG